MPVKKGDMVKVEYEGKFEDGTVFDSTGKCGATLDFEVGSGKVVKGIDDAVVGMKKGDEKEIIVQPADGNGERKDDLVKTVPKDPEIKDTLKSGMQLLVTLPEGTELPVKIVEVTDKTITIDLNHPLAGKVLLFRLKVREVEEKAKK